MVSMSTLKLCIGLALPLCAISAPLQDRSPEAPPRPPSTDAQQAAPITKYNAKPQCQVTVQWFDDPKKNHESDYTLTAVIYDGDDNAIGASNVQDPAGSGGPKSSHKPLGVTSLLPEKLVLTPEHRHDKEGTPPYMQFKYGEDKGKAISWTTDDTNPTKSGHAFCRSTNRDDKDFSFSNHPAPDGESQKLLDVYCFFDCPHTGGVASGVAPVTPADSMGLPAQGRPPTA